MDDITLPKALPENGIHSEAIDLHQRLSSLCSEFRGLQLQIIEDASPALAKKFQTVASELTRLCEININQVLGELYLSGHSTYLFTKPLYIAALVLELVKRQEAYHDDLQIDSTKKELLVLSALGHNLGLVAYKEQIYGSLVKLALEDQKKLREEYPQKSADLLKAIGIDQLLVLEVVRSHTVNHESPSDDVMLVRTPFVYAGIAMPQSAMIKPDSFNNPSQEFARMYVEKKLDPTLAGLFLKINGLAPIGSILSFDTNERAVVIKGPPDGDITGSMLRILTNRDGVQRISPGPVFKLDDPDMQMSGIVNHRMFAWSYFSPFMMWQK